MIQTFTLDDLIKYLYKEATEKENKYIARALIDDVELRKQYHEMVAVKEQLEHIQIHPSKACTDRILDYAKACNRQKVS